MRVEKQSQDLPVLNYDVVSDVKTDKKHCQLLGGCKRGIVVGTSGCGKTNVVLSLLVHPNGLRFSTVYLYSKTASQSKYQYLKKVLAPIKEIDYVQYEEGKDIIPPQKARVNSVILFDDIICEPQSVIRDYFCFGRHRNIDCLYLSQTYSAIPKHLIRDNANFLIIFKQDETNLKHIYDDHVNVDMPYGKFKELCLHCWKKPYGFLVVDKESGLSSGRYREGFDNFMRV